jgi:sugar lactone lactonase YvrE
MSISALRPVSLAVAVAVLLALPTGARANVAFDPFANEMPEGLALDRHGDFFVTLAPRGEVREIDSDGKQSTLAQLSPPGEGFGPLGLAFDRRGDLFVGVATFNPATGGVFEIPRHGHVVRIPGSEQIGLPNGLAFDDDGVLYVTDTSSGAVWRLPPHGQATQWLKHPLLAGTGSFGFGPPIGANGIVYDDDSLYVAVTEPGRIVRIPIVDDDTPGTPQVVAEDPALSGADGLQRDVRGNLYIAVNVQNRLVRLTPHGAITTIATAADGLDFPASPAFGTRSKDRKTLYVANLAIGHSNPGDAHPAVLSFPVGVRGEPLP